MAPNNRTILHSILVERVVHLRSLSRAAAFVKGLMKVLMLGWEYPPHISGGLGTACEGLSTALARLGVRIDFAVPHLFGGEQAPHMNLVDSCRGKKRVGSDASEIALDRQVEAVALAQNITAFRVPSYLQPYTSPQSFASFLREKGASRFFERSLPEAERTLDLGTLAQLFLPQMQKLFPRDSRQKSVERYSGDLFGEVARYTEDLISLMAHGRFDVIHAHDWLTYPAGVALRELTGRPLIAHVHSLEYDRSGSGGNERILQIERMGLESADAVVTVSYYTRNLVHKLHGIPNERIFVVHNGVYAKEVVQSYRAERRWPSKIVLFLGRITLQKGPDYFVEAAAHVLRHEPDVLFVMAGTGDMLPRMMHRVRELGIDRSFVFPGFLRGQEVEQVFSTADLYVMPSVSEPFGISALEAISFDTPVIISKQSGVSEVLRHALKADFWDVHRLADLIVNALRHDELRADLVGMAREELRRVRWDAAAVKTLDLYGSLLAGGG